MQPARALDRIKSFIQQQQSYRFTISVDDGETKVEAPVYAIVLVLAGVIFVLSTLIKLILEIAAD